MYVSMKKVISQKKLYSLIRESVSEALKYDKERRQYFPNYTGDAHSDAGKYVSNNRDDANFTRNDYKWSNPTAQRRFQNLQYQNDVENDPFDPDREHESDAEEYLKNREPDNIVNNAHEEMSGEFNAMFKDFITKAIKKYPILHNGGELRDFIDKCHDYVDELYNNI